AACGPARVGVVLEGPAEQCADRFPTQAPLGEVLGLGVDGEGLVEGPTVPGGGACEGSPHTVVELATGGAAGVLTGRQQGDEVLVPHPGALLLGVGQQTIGTVDGRDGGVGVLALSLAHVPAEAVGLDGPIVLRRVGLELAAR